jgi:multidrug efflux pump subunit AcrB
MLGIAALVFAWVVTPRMAIGHLPGSDSTRARRRHPSPGPGSAQTFVQQQVQFAMSAVPKSLGVIPPFVLQFDPTNAPVVQVTVSGGGLTGPLLYDYALNNVEPLLEGIPGVASASPNGGRQRQINVIVHRAEAQSRGVTAEEVAAAVAQSNALLPSGEFIASTFDTNVYTDAVPKHVRQIGDAMIKLVHGSPVYIEDVAQVEDGGAAPTQTVSVNGENAVYLNVLRIPGGNTIADELSRNSRRHDSRASGFRRRFSPRGRAGHFGWDAWEHQHAKRLDRPQQRASLLRRHVQDLGDLTQLPVHIAANAKPVTLGSYATIERAAGPIAIERDHMARVTEVYMQTEGRSATAESWVTLFK